MEQNQNPGGLQQLPTTNSQPTTSSKHFKAFWPIVLIATMSAVIGGLVVWAAFNAGLDEELNSLLPGADTRIAEKHKNFELQPMTSQAGELGSVNTSNWQTYKNEKYGFEFMYPGDLKVNLGCFGFAPGDNENDFYKIIECVNVGSSYDDENSFVFYVNTKKGSADTKTWLDEYLKNQFQEKSFFATYDFDDQQGYKFTSPSENLEEYLILKGSTIYSFKFWPSNTQQANIFSSVVNSFKLFKQ